MITPQDGVIIARRYMLTRPLARGGMGSVWVARHRELEIDVTVKFMDPSLVVAADARGRFEHEAKSAARLDSQHVVQVLDYGIENDTPYMVMELLRGETLAVRLKREGRLSLPAAARLVVQIGKALRTAHEAGLVHRDLKPSNVFLAIKDEDEVAKVLDFGIAKTTHLGADASGTESGTLLGSAHYMSPEQVRNSAGVDHRSDLWSLGVILYRMLVGRLPFPGKDFGDVLVRVCTDTAPAPSTIAPDLSPRVDAFFVRALARDPGQRFQSPREMIEAFCSVAMDARPGLSSDGPVSSSRVSEKRTMRMDLLSVPPPPPSSDTAALPMMETDFGTQIMRDPPFPSSRPAPGAPNPAVPADDDAATLARPSEYPSQTLRAAQPSQPTPNSPSHDAGSPPSHGLADDPPAVPVHALWPAWVAAGAVVVVALVVLALRGVAAGPEAGAEPAPSAAPPTRAVPAATATAVIAVTAIVTAPPATVASAAAPDAGVAVTATASAAPSAAPRPAGRPRSRVVDGIIRDPFAR